MHSPSPLTKIIFIQRCAKFACRTPKKVVKLCFVNKDFRETILDYSIELLLVPLLKCTTKTTNAEVKQISKNWKSFRRILSILFKHVSLSNLEILKRLLKFNYKFLLEHPDFQSLKPTIARVELIWQYFLSAVENSKLGVDTILDLFRMSDDTENEKNETTTASSKKSNNDRLVLPVKIRPSKTISVLPSLRLTVMATQLRQLVERAARAGNHEMLKTLLDSNNPLFLGKFLELIHEKREREAWRHEDGSVSSYKDTDYSIDMSIHRIFYYGFQNAIERGSVSCFKILVETRNKIVDISLSRSPQFGTLLHDKKHFSAQNMQHPFCRAVELNHVDIVRYAVEEFNQRPFDHFSCVGETIFCHALQMGSVDVVEYFLDWYFENITRKIFTSSSNSENVVFKPIFLSLRRRELEAMPDKLPPRSRLRADCYDNPFHMIARMKAKKLTKNPNVFVIPSGGNNKQLYPHERLGNNNNNNTLVEHEIVNDVAIRMTKLLVDFMKKEQEVYKNRPGMNEHFLAFQYDMKTLLIHQGTKFRNSPLQLALKIGDGEGNNKKFEAVLQELVENEKY